MHVLPARHCALLYPIEPYESNSGGIVLSTPRKLLGYRGEINRGEIIGIGIPIANEAEYSTFYTSQKSTESDLVAKIQNWMRNQ